MPRLKDLSGKRFGRLVVLERVTGPRHNKTYWACKCDCGKSVVIQSTCLIRGTTTSCSCARTDMHTKHGLTSHPLFNTWKQMMKRCYVEKAVGYQRYGGAGITVCDRWRNVSLFIQDNDGKKHSDLTLDRIDNTKGYSPDNCRWVDKKEQARNRSTTKLITYNDRTMTMTDWAKEYEVDQITLSRRIRTLGIEGGFKSLARPCCPNCGTPQPRERPFVYPRQQNAFDGHGSAP